MVLDDDSPLRRLPAALIPDQAMLLNGIRFCGEVVTSTMPKLRALLSVIASAERSGALYPEAMISGWGVVDASNRLRMLLTQADKQDWVDPERTFDEEVAVLEGARKVRNALQHFDERIQKAAKGDTFPPVWGSLSWFAVAEVGEDGTVVQGESCVLVPGSVASTKGVRAVNPAGAKFEHSVDQIGLQMLDDFVSLSALERSVERVLELLESSLRDQVDPDQPTRGADLLLRLTVRSQHSPGESADGSKPAQPSTP